MSFFFFLEHKVGIECNEIQHKVGIEGTEIQHKVGIECNEIQKSIRYISILYTLSVASTLLIKVNSVYFVEVSLLWGLAI